MLHNANKRRLLFGFLLYATILVAAITVIAIKSQQCKGISCLHVVGLGGFKTLDVYQDTDRIYHALLGREPNLLRVEVWLGIDSTEAGDIIKAQTIQMHTLYEKAVAPYPGEISNTISCADEYRPKYSVEKKNGQEVQYFMGYSNERLIFGACADDLISYRATVALFHCIEQKQLYKLELFSPINASSESFDNGVLAIRTVSCK